MRGVADIIGSRASDARETLAEASDDFLCIVKGQSGLGEVGEAFGVRNLEVIHFLDGANDDGAVRGFAGGAYDFLVVAMADEDEGAAFASKAESLEMNLGDQRAGGINDAECALLSLFADAGRNAVGAEDEYCAFGNLRDGFDEDGAAVAQLLDDIAVMNDFVMDVDGTAKGFEGELDDIDGANHASAEAAWADAHKGLAAVTGALNLSQHATSSQPLFYSISMTCRQRETQGGGMGRWKFW